MYEVHVLPIIDYCDVVQVPTNVDNLKRLERLHSRFSSFDSSSSVFDLTLAEHRRFHTAIQIYKILSQLSPSYLYSTFRFAISVKDHAGRNVHYLYVPAMHLNYGKQSLYHHGATIWISLPSSVIETGSFLFIITEQCWLALEKEKS